MRIEKITYGLSVNKITGENWEKIDAVISVGEGENEDEAFEKAKAKVRGWGNMNGEKPNFYNHIHQDYAPIGESNFTSGKNGSQPTITQVEKKLGVTVEDINSCQDKIVLQTYQYLVKGKPELEEAYLKKLTEFMK